MIADQADLANREEFGWSLLGVASRPILGYSCSIRPLPPPAHGSQHVSQSRLSLGYRPMSTEQLAELNDQPLPDIKSAGFLIFRSKPELSFLLLQHADRWDIPKGHCDPGETDLETAWRELNEETGLSPATVDLIPGFLWTHDYQVTLPQYAYEPRLKRLVVFMGISRGLEAIALTEHQGMAWFVWPPAQTIQARTIDPLLAAVADFFEHHPAAYTKMLS